MTQDDKADKWQVWDSNSGLSDSKDLALSPHIRLPNEHDEYVESLQPG